LMVAKLDTALPSRSSRVLAITRRHEHPGFPEKDRSPRFMNTTSMKDGNRPALPGNCFIRAFVLVDTLPGCGAF
jgi:hypothetical protein